MNRITRILLICLTLGGSGAFAQDFSISIESRMGWWLQSEDLLPLPLGFEGRVGGKVGQGEAPAAQYSASLRAAYDPDSAETRVGLGEAWVRSFLGPLDLTIGNQLVAWGPMDAFNPIDAVNPKDLSLPVEAEKKSAPMGRAVFNGQGFNADFVLLPFWTASDLPAARWRGASAFPPPGVVIDSLATVDARPERSWDNAQFGGRFQATLDWLQGFDLGLTFFRSRLSVPTPTLSLLPTGTAGHYEAIATLSYDRYSLAGLDAVLAMDGGILLKAEAVYKVLGDSPWLAPETGLGMAEGVAGLEFTLGQATIAGEFALDWAKGRADQGDSYAETMALMASLKPGSRWSLKAAAIIDSDWSGMVSPQASYVVADGLSAELKAFAFFGEPSTRYGAWKDNDLAEASLKYSF